MINFIIVLKLSFLTDLIIEKRLEKNPENLKIMKGIQKKQHKLLQKAYGAKILYPNELIEFVDNNPDLTHQQVADNFKKRVGPYGKEINRGNVIRTLDRYDQLQEGYGRTADELYEASSRLNAGKHYIAEYEKTGDISRFRHQVKSALNNMNQQEKKMFKIGKFNAGTLSDEVLFNDLYRSSTGKDARWKLVGEPPRDKDGKIKWTRDTSRNAEFIDTHNPKRKPIKFKNLKSYMEEFMPTGAYDDAIKSIDLNTFLKEQMVKYRGKETKLGGLLNKRIFSPQDWEDYMFGRSAFQRHHPGNIKDNWWKSENVFVDANQELNKIQQTFEANMKHLTGDARVKEMERFGNEVDNIIKKSGPISVETTHGTFGKAAKPEEVLEAIKKAAYSRSGDKALSRSINTLVKDKWKVRPPKAGAPLDNLIKKVPEILKALRKGASIGKTGLTGILSGFIGPGALAFEAALEGAVYEYYRRAGYTDEHAEAETFTYRLLKEAAKGKSTKDVPWWGGSEELKEKELYQLKGTEKENLGKIIGERTAVKRYIDNEEALADAEAKYWQLYTDYQTAIKGTDVLGEGMSLPQEEESYNKKPMEETWQEINRLKDQLDLDRDSYNAAKEKQETERGKRAIEYGHYGKGDTPALAKEREERRHKEFLDYRKGEQRTHFLPKGKLKERVEDPLAETPYTFLETEETLPAFSLEPGMRFLWDEIPRYQGEEGTKRKWEDLRDSGGWDLMDKIGLAGGVANMAEGGIASLKKK